MPVLMTLFVSLLAWFFILPHHSMAEPVQYCKSGAKHDPNADVDFCMGVIMHQNRSSSSHDLYLSMTHTRRNASALGWTAIGIGPSMTGALMFIVYGDPASGKSPIISIRGSTGHHQPTLVTASDMNGANIRVLQTAWMPLGEKNSPAEQLTYVAKISLVCYSCHLWPGTQLSAKSTSQPWIWAWNANQVFPVYSFDAHLDMHKHHASAGGWGNFYVDMARSINTAPYPPSLPPIRPSTSTLSPSSSPTTFKGTPTNIFTNPTWHLHALIMSLTFLLLFPAGVLTLRSTLLNSFQYHWILQLSGSLFLFLGITLGLFLSQNINTFHQFLGLFIATAALAQGVLGWRHHVTFLSIRRRTWLSYIHIWLGRLMMVGGWSNILTGMLLHGYSGSYIIVAGVMVGMEMLGLAGWVWRVCRKKQQTWVKEEEENYFALEGDEGDEKDSLDLGDGSDEQRMGMLSNEERK